MYSKEVLEHFKQPHNYGKIKNPDGVGKVGNVVCGDVMWLYIKVKDGVITDIKFETFGCVAALASSSIITDLAKGKTLEKAAAIGRKEIVDSLGGLPPIKVHCSVLASDALSEAVYDYLKKKGKEIPADLERKHKRIGKEKEIIEEKYHDWVKVEEKMHEDKA